MSLMALLELALGLALVYLLLSTLCSSIVEWHAQRAGLRGEFLRRGLLQLLPDRWLYLRLVNHPAIAPLYRDAAGGRRRVADIPAGIAPEQFALALVDLLQQTAARLPAAGASTATPVGLPEAVQRCASAGFTTAKAVLPLLDPASPERTRFNIAQWFDATMSGVVTGWYKQRVRRNLFWVGLVVAIVLNVDSLVIGKVLLEADSLRSGLAEKAAAIAQGGQFAAPGEGGPVTREDLERRLAEVLGLRERGLPLGYACLGKSAPELQAIGDLSKVARACWRARPAPGELPSRLAGWLLTALAVSLGAPFWFDLLGRLADLRGAGRKPARLSSSA